MFSGHMSVTVTRGLHCAVCCQLCTLVIQSKYLRNVFYWFVPLFLRVEGGSVYMQM